MTVAPDTERTSTRRTGTGLDPAQTPDSDPGLARTAGKQGRTGGRLLALGAGMFALGLLLVILGEDIVNFAGLALIGLSAPPAMAGTALLLSGLVGKRSAQHKPFA